MDAKHAQFDGSIPENYDHGLGPHIFADYGRNLAERVAACEPGRVLELAAGTGIVTRMLRDELPPKCELVATDLNEPMLDVARKKFDPSDAVTFEPADAQQLPYDAAAFDVVACQFGIMFFPDKVGSMRETRRVLRPGGRYVFNVWGPLEKNPFARMANEVVSGFFAEDPPGFYHVPFSYHDEAVIRSALEEAGFGEVRIDTDHRRPTVADFERFAQGLIYGNPIVEEIRDRGSVEPDEAKQALIAAFRKEFGTEPVTMPLEAHVVTATSPGG